MLGVKFSESDPERTPILTRDQREDPIGCCDTGDPMLSGFYQEPMGAEWTRLARYTARDPRCDMPRVFVFLALSCFALVDPGIASEAANAGATACLALVKATLFDYEQPPGDVELCNSNEHCLDARRFIGQHRGKPIPELTCSGASASSSQAATKFFNDIYANVCVETSLMLTNPPGGAEIKGSLRKRIALCNQSPDKSTCREMQVFLDTIGLNRGLSCK